jgi:predicted transcriptional regulator of viral defense system
MVTQNITLGSQELKLIFSLEEKGISIFTFSDAKNILRSTDSSMWNVLDGLRRKNRIQRIAKGRYLLVPARAGYKGHWTEEALVILPHIIDVYYVGFWSAMNYWNMTEQMPITVFVATTKRKRDMEYGAQKFRFITLSKKKFFGYVQEENNDIRFNISSKEKTILDGLMHPEYCGGMSEVVKAMWNARKDVDWQTVLEMSRKVRISSVMRRLGYLLSMLGVEKDISDRIKKEGFKGYRFLDPLADKKRLSYSKDFGLIINRTKNELTSWMGR